ncbi:hypothetical protein N780_13110 [Pontibacillus chungwhensis BH030062]|uniref:Uncharacterized protein n=1 Tax=Pontibacillus chungwhensis BH030062 TaxID=1385513 RepID=A0A0A2V2N5_9BACI|nr:hypothetical protein N780_13110 [Pontibacillus chungwhensis BH030062]
MRLLWEEESDRLKPSHPATTSNAPTSCGAPRKVGGFPLCLILNKINGKETLSISTSTSSNPSLTYNTLMWKIEKLTRKRKQGI